MAERKLFNKDRRPKRSCRFTVARGDELDYKDIDTRQRVSLCSTNSWISATWAKSSRSKTVTHAENQCEFMTVTDHYVSAMLIKLGSPVLKPQIRMHNSLSEIAPAMLKRWATHYPEKPRTRSKPHENWKSRKVTHAFPPYFHPISPGYPQRYPAWDAET